MARRRSDAIPPRRQGPAEQRLLAFLQDPASYPHGPSRVRLVQTHSAWVLIASPWVYKVKRPVDFGFLDFSTLAKRRRFCGLEVELNRRLCPDTYLGVVPISRRGDALAFGDGEEVIEYAVRMRELPAAGFFDRRLRRGRLGTRDLDLVAATLAKFYRAQHPERRVLDWGRIERLRISTDENFRQLRRQRAGAPPEATLAAIRRYTDDSLRRRRAMFESRVRERRIREGHGDLRLEHLHLASGRLRIFDCIEFSERLRCVDVASDVAFLAMDLDFEDRPDLSQHFGSAMAQALDDPGLLQLLDFYKCYRAVVRGKVERFSAAQPGLADRLRRAHEQRAARYFRLALRYAVAGSTPLVIAACGRIATGKSTLAAGLAAELGWELVSSDKVRKQLAGVAPMHRGSAEERRRLYSVAMTRRTYDALATAAVAAARDQRGLVLDATYGRCAERTRLMRRLAEQDIACRFVETIAPERQIRQRLRQRDQRDDVVSDARLEDYQRLSAAFEPPEELDATRRVQVATAGGAARALSRALQGLVGAALEEKCR